MSRSYLEKMEREHGLSGNGARSAGARGWEEMLEGCSRAGL